MSDFESDHLKSEIDELVPGMVALRRDLHEHPELAFEEIRTSGLVTQRLRTLGLEVQTGVAKTGVDGVIGLHLMSTYPVGRVGVRAGAVFASADGLVLRVNGR